MTIDLKNVLETMKKPYGFRVKLACDIRPDACCKMSVLMDEKGTKLQQAQENFKKATDIILKAKGMTKCTQLKEMPLVSQPMDFRRLQGFIGKIYTCDMEFEYPITPSELTNELCTLLNMDRAFVVVRTLENPYVQIDDDYLEYSEKDYIPSLIDDTAEETINVDMICGDEYNKELVKALQSKEAKKYQGSFKEVDTKTFNNME